MIGLYCWTSDVRSTALGRRLPAHLVSHWAIWCFAAACRQRAGLALLVMRDCRLSEQQISFLPLQGA